MKFEIIDVDGLGRLGKIRVNNREMTTPNLFPVVHPFNNSVSILELEKIGAQCIFTNSFILYQNENLREKVRKEGIHNHLNFNGIVATDSGAFQQYFYDNQQFSIDSETIEKFQEDIESDFPVILDLPVQINDDYYTAKEKVNLTIKRAKENIVRRKSEKANWIGPIHGGIYTDLLSKSAIEMSKLDFAIYALGGLVKMFLDYRFELPVKMLLTVKKNITPNKPIHMFGLGLPQFFSLAVACGCDLMDSAAYILYAKENRYFTLSTGTKNLNELEEFPCNCPICSNYTPNDLKEFDKDLRIKLLAKHNLYVSFSELKTIRQSIREGNLWELVEQRVRCHPNLVNALRMIKDDRSFFEKYEKVYKNHGRLYSSEESLYRPLIFRYHKKLINTYRVPKEVLYLLILPELDLKGKNSPSIINWLNKLDRNAIINRQEIHIVFSSYIYGIVPIELIDTFPLGQYESIEFNNSNSLLNNNYKLIIEQYFKKNFSKYHKCAILIPDFYLDQYKQKIKFSEHNVINSLKSIISPFYKSNLAVFKEIDSVLNFFKGDE